MSTTDRNPGQDRGILLGTGALAGAVAYLLGYAITYLWQGPRVEERLSRFNFVVDLLGGDPIPTWTGVGWLFYNAHRISTRFPWLGGTRSENFIAASDDGTLTLLYLVPPVLLLAAGFAVATLRESGDVRSGGIAGATVAVGYLPLVVLGAFLFRFSIGDGTLRPGPMTAVVLAGIVYPVVFGITGGAVAGVYRDRSTD